MQDVYNEIPNIEDERFLIRLVKESDADDLLKVYGDKRALPYFNSDNCNGDNFYYTTEGQMAEAIRYWLWEYENRCFVRFAILDKAQSNVVGTIELFKRKSEDYFNDFGILRLDVRAEYEECEELCNIMSLMLRHAYELFECKAVATKAPIYAVERIAALEKMGFVLSEKGLQGGHDGKVYDWYWVKSQS